MKTCTAPDHQGRPRVALYQWVCHGGIHSFSLCPGCAGWWMVNAIAGGAILPQCVALIADPSSYYAHEDV